MKKQGDEHLDRLIKQKLEAFEAEPGPGVWNGILMRYEKQAKGAFYVRRTRNLFVLLMLSLILIVLHSDHFQVNVSPENGLLSSPGVSENPLTPTGELDIKKDQRQTESPAGNRMQETQNAASFPGENVRNKLAFQSVVTDKEVATEEEAGQADKKKIVPSSGKEHIAEEVQNQDNTPVFKDPQRTPFRIKELGIWLSGKPHDHALKFVFPKESVLYVPEKSPSSGFRPVWSLGLFYIPELYHSTNTHSERTLLGFESLLKLRRYHYTLETGLGFSVVSNDNLFTIDYNPYLGSYKDLDSISFVVDPVSQAVVPQYYFNEVTVYDTATQTYYTRMKNQYAYLQIPVFFGYRTKSFDRLSFSLKGGPMVALLVGANEPDAYFDPERKKIIRIQDKTPGRVRTSWQFLMNAGVSMQMTHHLHLSLEPGLRFHLNPIYDMDGARPWSVNLRMGMIYEF